MKHWKLLYSGGQWDLLNPDPGQLHPLDIAVPLSRMPRWCGHTVKAYNVAEHSVHVSRLVYEMTDGDRVAAAQGLLHEADEPFLNDIPTPVKDLIPAIRELAEVQQRAAFHKFDLPWPMHPAVKYADGILFASEAAQNMPDCPREFYDPGDNFVRLQYWTTDEAYGEFMREGQSLGLW